MKVVHINHSDWGGGAAIAAHRLHEAMLLTGLDSTMLVVNKNTTDDNVREIQTSKFRNTMYRCINKVINFTFKFFGTWSLNIYGYDLSNENAIKNADIIYLHWINANTLSLKSIEKILSLGKQVYWVMHDMWPITGGCHHSMDCNKFSSNCTRCPLFFNRRGSSISIDLSYIQFQNKIKHLKKYSNLNIITPSRWLYNQVKISYLFSDKNIYHAPNLINPDIFVHKSKKEAREKLNLPIDKTLLLFGADNFYSPYKGWNLLKEALKNISNRSDKIKIECVIYGMCEKNVENEIGLKCHILGTIKDTDKLVSIYNSCDLFIIPSIAENYPNVILEANACGLPVLGTAVGGIPEMIKENVNGMLIKKLTVDSFTSQLSSVLSKLNDFNPEIIRSIVIENNSYDKVMKIHNFVVQ